MSQRELNDLIQQRVKVVYARWERGEGDPELQAAKAEVERLNVVSGNRRDPGATGDRGVDLANLALAAQYRAHDDFRGVLAPHLAEVALQGIEDGLAGWQRDPVLPGPWTAAMQASQLLRDSATREQRFDSHVEQVVARLTPDERRHRAAELEALADALDVLGLSSVKCGHTYSRPDGRVGRSGGHPLGRNLRDLAATLTLSAPQPAAPPGSVGTASALAAENARGPEEPRVPADQPARARTLVRALEDYAARYGHPGAPGGGGPEAAARYVIEGHVRDATREEWDWAYRYLREHPQLLDGTVKTDEQLADERAQEAEVAAELAAEARVAFDGGDRQRALDLIAQAEELDPQNSPRWDRIRGVISAQAPTEPRTGPRVSDPDRRSPSEPSERQAAELPEAKVHRPSAVTPPARFRPVGTEPLVPSGSVARTRANIAALRTLRTLRTDERPATEAEQRIIAAWSGWGAVPEVFDSARSEFAWAREELASLLSEAEWKSAARSTLNAHYTDPGLVAPIWRALQELGFTEGRVLEPGCGSGNFIAAAPDGARMVGVEVEAATAQVAAALYPDAQILSESFADTTAPEGAFDLTVGNVPFAKSVLTDRQYNRGGHSIHNHFLIKSLHLTAPGGLVAVITSRYTLDAANPAARREMAELADLVGAIRLPRAAHQRAAGTPVVTDLLVLRRREPDAEPVPDDWEMTQLVAVDGQEIRISSYFAEHPEMICGTLAVGRGQFSDAEPTVISERPAAELLREKLELLVARAHVAGLAHSPTVAVSASSRAALVARSAELPAGHLMIEGDEFVQINQGAAEPFAVPRTQRPELRELLGLRDTVVALLEAEAASLEPTAEIDQLRAQLKDRYDGYSERFGPLNRFTWRRTGRTHPETGEEILARIQAKQGGFRSDPDSVLVYALENFDSTSQQATKADIFTQRVVAPRTPRLGADSPEDALAICMDTHGRADLDEIARLLGVGPDEARARLARLVFDDPAAPGTLIPAAEYLSGQVRDKLALARAAATEATDDRFAANIAALEEVVPPDIAPEDIVARFGASWIDGRYVEQFLRETLEDPSLTVEHPYGSQWLVKGRDFGINATSTWGTEDLSAPQIASALLKQQPITVHDEFEYTSPEGSTSIRRKLNVSKTVAAQAKADQLTERFSDWVWEDPQRAVTLARVYNDRFNSLVLRNYDEVELSLPGLALTFEPNPHQVAAVARMISEPAVGLYHEVGAGKTAEMAMGVMELRRLKMIRKPAIVIPNHMLEQWAREFQQLYPQAKVLAASSADLTRDRRRAFVARIATGDWDAVILTRSAFERIPMTAEAQGAYLDNELAELRAALEREKAEGIRSLSTKRMEARLLSAEERIKEKLARDYDPAVTFERSGIDYVVVDEAHDYKNLRTVSNIPGAAIEGSNRATDLDMKLHYLRNRHGLRVGTLATATPIANSITEAHVMQRYLRPDLLDAAGVRDFDTWAATFGQSTTDVELSPDGGSFRLKQRFARFHNVPELLRMWWVSGDVKTAEDLKLPRPELLPRPEDGQRAPRTFVIPPSPQLQDYIVELAARAEKVQQRAVEPDQDNMLLISSNGRAAALDMRLVGQQAPPGESKIDVAADEIARIWQENRDNVYYEKKSTREQPVRGALQLVFCDLSTPHPERWNVYEALRELLVERGLPAQQIRFIHEARNDREKGELFEACRTGRVSVLVGSTAKMGVGTNVQDRAIALHHLDCPWRPADLAQRDGRALRRGNQHSEIGLYRYVVEGSFDAYSWQTVGRKATFIAQVMRGRLDQREIEDIGDSALSYNEVKALAAGNPLLLDKAKADADLARLERLERSHVQARSRLRYSIEQNQRAIGRLEGNISSIEAAVVRVRVLMSL
ncbi:SNF2-related protein [Pseudonocardia xishanensis]|uniref:Helicase C-terminal domain-containing protein n=1 Tax=Pseudonocardia xishanensis TaxID=630995 RepID=A0ABP8RZS8_9PSEU